MWQIISIIPGTKEAIYRRTKDKLKAGRTDPALTKLLEQMEQDLDIYGEDAVRVWSSSAFTDRQAEWVQSALQQSRSEKENMRTEEPEQKAVEQRRKCQKGR